MLTSSWPNMSLWGTPICLSCLRGAMSWATRRQVTPGVFSHNYEHLTARPFSLQSLPWLWLEEGQALLPSLSCCGEKSNCLVFIQQYQQQKFLKTFMLPHESLWCLELHNAGDNNHTQSRGLPCYFQGRMAFLSANISLLHQEEQAETRQMQNISWYLQATIESIVLKANPRQ